jgi:hypothetical protein
LDVDVFVSSIVDEIVTTAELPDSAQDFVTELLSWSSSPDDDDPESSFPLNISPAPDED